MYHFSYIKCETRTYQDFQRTSFRNFHPLVWKDGVVNPLQARENALFMGIKGIILSHHNFTVGRKEPLPETTAVYRQIVHNEARLWLSFFVLDTRDNTLKYAWKNALKRWCTQLGKFRLFLQLKWAINFIFSFHLLHITMIAFMPQKLYNNTKSKRSEEKQ